MTTSPPMTPTLAMARAAYDQGSPWTAYAEVPPPAAGVYEWRMSSRACDGLVIGVYAHYRERGAGGETVLSPSFDHWNGYRVTVPADLQWRRPQTAPDIRRHQAPIAFVEGVALEPCPFCRSVPAWRGSQQTAHGGIVVNPDPRDLNSWSTGCCGWASQVYFSDPRKLAERRNTLLRALQPQDPTHAE